MATEIERKFLVTSPPDAAALGTGVPIRQGYLAGEGDVETRVRITPSGARITVKAGGGIARTEVEVEIPVDEAEELWPHTAGRQLQKVRYRVPVDGGVAEVDCYEGELAELWTVEVEFATSDDAARFVPPDWFGLEVSEDGSWSNAALARRGRPDR